MTANNITVLPDGCGRDEVRDFLRHVCEVASVRGKTGHISFVRSNSIIDSDQSS